MSKDIALILGGWEYNANEVTVRKILGIDGREKIQMRLDLGVLQMETDGRPDGKMPHGCDSLLEYCLLRLQRYRDRHGDTEGFEMSSEECADLKQEAMQYYYRYLSLFHLGDYLDVIRDTDHNLRIFDLIREYAVEESDRLSLEQFRPYVLMMNTRARACLSLDERDFDRALDQIADGIERIEDFLREVDREEMIENCREIVFLQEWSERIRTNRPLSDEEKLRRELRLAVEAENYERAAQIRDQIREMAHS
ncbi:MAG: UvrB/UvrC motif-containing protein [Abitibacteriaceae bacterium]|nr:UvrB/UvrC motif-containing protein [Abditibacteriaceae bacterium]